MSVDSAIVALATPTEELVGAHKAALLALEQEAHARALTRMAQFRSEFSPYLARVVANNPVKSIQDILARQDVSRFLSQSLGKARRDVIAGLRASWTASSALGASHAGQEFADLGLPNEPGVPTSPVFLDSILSDVMRNFARFETELRENSVRVFASIPTPPSYQESLGGVLNVPVAHAAQRAIALRQALDQSARALEIRISASNTVAINRAYSEAHLRALEALVDNNPGLVVKKVWIANFSQPTPPCKACTDLHGTVLDVDVEFSSPGLRVYRDLLTPPRHPNCRCRLVMFVESLEESVTDVVPPEIAQIVGQPDEAPPVAMISAQQIRDMPSERYNSLVAFFLAVIKTVAGLLRGNK